MVKRRSANRKGYRHLSPARLLLIGLILTLPGCSEGNEESTSGSAVSSAKAAEKAIYTPRSNDGAPDPVLEKIKVFTGDLDGMVERRVVRVLTVYSVGRYFLDGPRERGLVKEISDQFEKHLNQSLKTGNKPVHVVVIPVARDQLIPALLSGKGDIINASLSITASREQQIDFSLPVTKPVDEILVTGPSAPAVSGIDDLAGATLYVRQSSSYRESLDALNRQFAENGREAIRIESVSELLEDDDLVEMVNAGLLPWAVVDDYKLAWWRDVFTDIVPREDIVLRSGTRFAWGLRPNSPQLKKVVDEFVAGHREGTLLGNILRNRYIRDFDWAGNAMEEQALDRLSELEALFEKYGDKYDVEPLMLAAQGYQESKLDQSARNRSGAIGIMQIKRSTALDLNVNVKGIEKVEPNIHAGAKYLAFLRDRYFSDPGIDKLNRNLLALAAYNMGPARMIKLRRQAADLGYDPNLWFDNVELAAAKYVSHEPVTYVANIFKYYGAYSINMAQIERHQAARKRAGIEGS